MAQGELMPDRIGPYELRGELGRGAMAVVWRAWDTRLEREVALKEPVLPPGLDAGMSSEFADRFVREAKTVARLNHPGIVTIYNAEIYDGRPVIAMEVIQGQVLSSVLASGPLPVPAAMSMIDQMLDALACAHGHGIVHRDVKPENIFVLPDGRLKLTDFGIAHVDNSSKLTQAGTVMGTPGYMAPEQVTGAPVDARSDLFSVGVVGYEMLTGRNPFGASDGTAPTAVMYRIVQEDAAELRAIRGDVPPHLSDVLRVAMAKDPAYRFPTAEAMRQALAGEPIIVAGPSGAPRTYPPIAATVMSPYAMQLNPAAAGQAWATPVDGNRSHQRIYMGLAVAGVLVIGGLLVAAMGGSGGARAGSAPLTPSADSSTGSTSSGTSEAQSASPAKPAGPTEAEDRAALSEALQAWQTAWQSMDIDRYMSNYSSRFYSQYKGYDHDAWRAWKADIFAKYQYQRVAISDVNITITGDQAVVAFTQDFRSDSLKGGAEYHDTGRKKLTFARESTGWFITGEEFVKY